MTNATVFTCPACFATSIVGTTCPHCGVEMVRPQLVSSRTLDPQPVKNLAARLVEGGALAAMTGAAAAVMLPPIAPIAVATLGIGAAVMALGVGSGLRGARRRMERVVAERFRSVPRTLIADAPEGEVSITGVATLIEPGYSLLGEPCVAYLSAVTPRWPLNGTLGTPTLWVGANPFRVVDGSGVNALIRAPHVVIARAIDSRSERIIPDGARVEITGRARIVPVPDVSANYRGCARILEFESTPDHPIAIRRIDSGGST